MMPNIKHSLPPNFKDIIKIFPAAENPDCIFAYGHTIYIPNGKKLPIQLLKHEFVHCQRQGTAEDGIIEWWDKYLKDLDFRYVEEKIAHIAEYQKACEISINRQQKRQHMSVIAKRLSSSLYGNMVTYSEARRVLKNA